MTAEESLSLRKLKHSIQLASVAGLFAIVAVVFALVIFVTEGRAERSEMCDIISEVTLGSAQALVAASAPEDPSILSKEELDRRKRAVDRYLDNINRVLERCQ